MAELKSGFFSVVRMNFFSSDVATKSLNWSMAELKSHQVPMGFCSVVRMNCFFLLM